MQQNRLMKSPDKRITGVCAGLAEHLGVSTTMVRIAYASVTVFLALMPGLFFYAFLAYILPERPDGRSSSSQGSKYVKQP